MAAMRTIKGLLDRASGIQNEEFRIEALKDVAPYVPEKLQPKLLKLVRQINNEPARARLLGTVAPRLHLRLRPALLRAALDIKGTERDAALVNIAQFLPESSQRDLLDATCALDEQSRGWVLGRVAQSLPLELKPDLLAATLAIQDEELRAKTLNEATQFLPQTLGSEALAAQRDLLAGVSAIRDEKVRKLKLEGIAPYLPEALHSDVFTAACAIQAEPLRADLLSIIAPYLPKVLQPDLLAAVGTMQEEPHRAEALQGVAPFLPETLHSQLLVTISSLQDEELRAKTLSTVARRISKAHKSELLAAARSIPSYKARGEALEGVTPFLLGTLESELLAAKQELLAAVCSIKDEGTRADALIDVATSHVFLGQLDEDLLGAVQQIHDPEIRRKALRAVAPHFPFEWKPKLLAAAHELNDQWLLKELMRPPRPERVFAAPSPADDYARAVALEKERRTPVALDTPGPQPRYATVQIFEEKETGKRGPELSEDGRLRAQQWYQAVVSIRVRPIGVQTSAPRRPIRQPKQEAPVDIFVTAHSLVEQDFRITPHVDKIVLPPSGDSTADAVFRLQPLRSTHDLIDVAKIRFRLFYRYNLLEKLTLSAGVLPAEDNGVDVARPQLTQDRQCDPNDFDLITPSELHIDIELDNGQYVIVFTYPELHELKFTSPISLSPLQLEDQIREARRVLFQVSASDTLQQRVDGDTNEFQKHMAKLAAIGRDLWAVMFCHGPKGGMSTIGEWLTTNRLREGGKIQISTRQDDFGFAFAWNLLYELPYEDAPYKIGVTQTPVVDGFWGFRYVVEQRIVLPAPPENWSEHIEIGAMYWKFAQTPDQQRFLNELLDRTQRKATLFGSKPIDGPRDAELCLKAGTSHILYFFTHGHTRQPRIRSQGVTIEDFVELYDKLPHDSPTRNAWHDIYERIRKREFDQDSSWIELSSGRLKLPLLYRNIKAMTANPIVILNMCDSAQVTPSLADSFIEFFLTRGARAVLGTECSMRPVFEDFVARQLLPSLLSGQAIGEATRQIRLAAAKKNNPLGLAYTLFGAADAALRPPVLIGGS
ncbi:MULTISPECIES: hypothetical protein [unclassified Bradyrhizobium]|uniref:hypothetical protein n=1 Tax=unclassified Bradyrhizobium TaxID=2631580 RepID=UPI002916CC70|nr:MULTISPECIES: hypothetical protein [unclassified Bradyrhizobium]